MKVAAIGRHTMMVLLAGGVLVAQGIGQQAAKPPAPAPSPKTAAAQVPSAEGPKKVVMKVGTQKITEADMEYLISSLPPQLRQAVAIQGKKPLGEQYAVMEALSQQAEKDRLDASEAFREQMSLQRLQVLAQAEYQKMSGQIKVSPEEINQYYSDHTSEFDEAQVREVVIRKKPDGAKEGTPGLSATDAHARADEIRKALGAGTDPKEIAKKFGVENTVQIDAEPRTIKHKELKDPLDQAAFTLKDGGISDPLENADALAFLQVVGHTHQDLKAVSEDIGNTLHDQKLQTAVEDLKKKTDIWMDEQYFKAPSASSQPTTPVPQPK